MTNSDDTFGVHNIQYMIYCEHTAEGGGVVGTNDFANIDDAKAYFFHADALAMFEENCTWLGWRLPKDGVDAGTAGWGDQFNTRRQTLQDADEWVKETYPTFSTATSEDHLF